MQAVNNVGGMTKKQAKKMQKMIAALQKELADDIVAVMEASGEPMDMAQIVEAYPDNERRKSSNPQELKQYISMGLGKLIQDGKVRELPRTADGRFLLELAV